MVVQGAIRRFGGAFVIAAIVAFVLLVAKSAEAQMIPSMCAGLDSGDLEWWLRMCYVYPSLLEILKYVAVAM